MELGGKSCNEIGTLWFSGARRILREKEVDPLSQMVFQNKLVEKWFSREFQKRWDQNERNLQRIIIGRIKSNRKEEIEKN